MDKVRASKFLVMVGMDEAEPLRCHEHSPGYAILESTRRPNGSTWVHNNTQVVKVRCMMAAEGFTRNIPQAQTGIWSIPLDPLQAAKSLEVLHECPQLRKAGPSL